MQKHKRAVGLDGLRGAAALTVALNHFFNLFPPNRWTPVWKYTPLCMLIAGHEAVLVFFLLSGFALHEMVAGAESFQYWRFALRRVLRIYGPYLCALALAVAGNLWVAKGFRPGFSTWFNRKWTLPVATSEVWAHVAFVGDYNTDRFNDVYWSLVHEMRISLIFPALYWLVRGWRVSWVIGLAVVMMLVGTILNPAIGTPNNIGETLHYAGFFPLGIAIAERRTLIAGWYARWRSGQKAVLVVCAALLFYYGRGVTLALPKQYFNGLDIPVGLGAAVIVVLSTQSEFFTRELWQWLGKRSYSLYLTHIPLLMGLVNLVDLQKPTILLALIYIPGALVVAELFYQLIERPFLRLSRRVG